VLTVASVLFLRSLINLARVDTGFPRDGIMLVRINSDVLGLKSDDPRMLAMFSEIEQRTSAVPGVHAASFASFIFHQGSWNGGINIPGVPYDDNVNIKHNVIGVGYFNTMQIPLLAGRAFGPQDTATSHKVVIISESMARDLFPAGVNPIGRHFFSGHDPIPETSVEVVGIAKNVKFDHLQEGTQYIDYIPNPQHPWGYGTLAVRYTGDFNSVAAGVRNAILAINRTLPIGRATTLDRLIERTITNQRLVAQLSAFFGLLAVFLSCIGIYGLMSYMVSRRTNEIGIRIAIGASRANVRWLVMREIVLLVAIGVGIGVPATLAGGRVVANMLFGLRGTDVATLIASVFVLLLVGVLAGYLPARRAASVDPVIALRYE
jgi:predicted permease